MGVTDEALSDIKAARRKETLARVLAAEGKDLVVIAEEPKIAAWKINEPIQGAGR